MLHFQNMKLLSSTGWVMKDTITVAGIYNILALRCSSTLRLILRTWFCFSDGRYIVWKLSRLPESFKLPIRWVKSKRKITYQYSLTFFLDMSFMYITAVLCMIKLYHSRHPDINATAYLTFGVLAMIILLGAENKIFTSLIL